MMDKPLASSQRGESVRRALQNRYGLSRRGQFVLLSLLIWFTPLQAADNVLKHIDFSALPGSSVQIILTAERAVTAQPKVFTTDNPPRIVLDLFGMTSGLENKTQPIGVGMARSVTAVEAEGRTRVVVNLIKQIGNNIEVDENRVIVTIVGSSEPAVSAAPIAPVAPTSLQPARVVRESGSQIAGVDLRRGNLGEGQVILQLSDPKAVIDMRQEGSRVVLDVLKTQLPDQFARKYDVSDFATPVKMVEVSARGQNTHVEIQTAGEYEHLAFQADGLLTVEFRPLTKREKEEIERKRDVFTGERLSLNFQDIPVRSVLQLLADFTDLNLVTSDNVQGQITLRLQNVPWDQALDIILKARGLSMRQNGNVIMVAPTQEINQREQLELEAMKQVEELAPLQFEYIQLNYANAGAIKSLLKDKDNELLTPGRGSVTVDKRTNTLLLKDTASKLESLRQVIQRLDVPVRQVMIDSRVVIAESNFSKELGVRFGFNRSFTSGDTFFTLAGAQTGHIRDTDVIAPGISVDTRENLMVNLPAPGATSGANLLIGKVGSFLLQLELSAMQQEGRGEIVSNPRVVTSDNETAIIKQGSQIPYSTVSQDGTNTVFKDAVLKLEVTPNITPDDRVIMKLSISRDNPSTSVAAADGTRGIDTRSIDTTVLVDNGETVVLGGVFERTLANTTNKVPFLGDLPVLGLFFRSKLHQDDNRELLIFVTPKILKESLSVR